MNKPCPFCGSENLRELDITICGDDGEVDVIAIECLDCDAQARADRWNDRAEIEAPTWQQKLVAMGDAEEELHL